MLHLIAFTLAAAIILFALIVISETVWRHVPRLRAGSTSYNDVTGASADDVKTATATATAAAE